MEGPVVSHMLPFPLYAIKEFCIHMMLVEDGHKPSVK